MSAAPLTRWHWILPLLVTAIAGVLRFTNLAHPDQLIFDETYYPKDAYSLLESGYERRWDEDVNDAFARGEAEPLEGAAYVVHPPLGKWLIGLGMLVFGPDNGVGWRFSAAVAGTLSVLLVALATQHLLRSVSLGAVAGLLLAVEGHHLVMSRIGLLDIFLSFFVLAAFAALLADRVHGRRLLAERLAHDVARLGRDALASGPWLGWRPWRLLAGVLLGAGCAVKLSGLAFMAAFGLLTVLWDMSARRTAGVRHWAWAGVEKDGLYAFVAVVGGGLVAYLFLAASGVLLLLPLVPGLGLSMYGARIWIDVGFGTFQPGEIAKITLAIFFAGYLSANRDLILLAGRRVGPVTFPRARDLGPLLAGWLLALGVLVFQRDLGSALLFFGMFMAMLYIATSRASWILLGLGLIAFGAALAFLFMPHVTARFEIWLRAFDPEIYHRDFGGSYQVVQGLFAMASGGLMGTGLGAGNPTQVPLSFSDMILTAIGEELGFVGLAAVLVLYLLLVTRMMRAALGVRDAFGKVLASGLAFTMAWQVFVVMGGVTLVLPLTGLTTPFLAAGGSSLLANWIIVGLVLRISNAARRPVVVDGMVNASGPGAGHLDPGTALPAAAVPPGGGEER
ncbi:FtsW/RodA/SpoVE family cell cycle protein [Micrococcus sp. KRD026]